MIIRTIFLAVFSFLLALAPCAEAVLSARSRKAQPRYRRMTSTRQKSRWQIAGSNVAVYAGARYHAERSAWTDPSFEKGDIGGVLGLELHESTAYWQVLLGGMQNPGGSEANIRYSLTPELNLLLKDRTLVGGVGLLWTYVSPREGESDWSDMYYQLLLGFSFPFGGRFSLEALAQYPFAKWNRLKDFSGSDLEYSAGLSFQF